MSHFIAHFNKTAKLLKNESANALAGAATDLIPVGIPLPLPFPAGIPLGTLASSALADRPEGHNRLGEAAARTVGINVGGLSGSALGALAGGALAAATGAKRPGPIAASLLGGTLLGGILGQGTGSYLANKYVNSDYYDDDGKLLPQYAQSQKKRYRW